jgi:hypothetical protein
MFISSHCADIASLDFFLYAHAVLLDKYSSVKNVDIHHIFPQDWCKRHGIKPNVFDSIINKTPLSYRTNRIISGVAPSEYIAKLEKGDHTTPRLIARSSTDFSGLTKLIRLFCAPMTLKVSWRIGKRDSWLSSNKRPERLPTAAMSRRRAKMSTQTRKQSKVETELTTSVT